MIEYYKWYSIEEIKLLGLSLEDANITVLAKSIPGSSTKYFVSYLGVVITDLRIDKVLFFTED